MNLFMFFEAGTKAVKGESAGKVIKKGKKEQPRQAEAAATSSVSKT